MRHNITRATDALVTVTKGPFAIARGCRLCNFVDVRRCGRGRGAGFREGNKQRGRLHAHMKEAHPEALVATCKILAADGWQSIPPNLPIHHLKKLDHTNLELTQPN